MISDWRLYAKRNRATATVAVQIKNANKGEKTHAVDLSLDQYSILCIGLVVRTEPCVRGWANKFVGVTEIYI